MVGFGTSATTLSAYPGSDNGAISYASNGRYYNNGGNAALGGTFAIGDVLGVVLGRSLSNQFRVYKNGVLTASITFPGATNSGTLFPIVGASSGSTAQVTINLIPIYPLSGITPWST